MRGCGDGKEKTQRSSLEIKRDLSFSMHLGCVLRNRTCQFGSTQRMTGSKCSVHFITDLNRNTKVITTLKSRNHVLELLWVLHAPLSPADRDLSPHRLLLASHEGALRVELHLCLGQENWYWQLSQNKRMEGLPSSLLSKVQLKEK